MTVSIRKIFRYTLLAVQIMLVIPIGWFAHHMFMPRAYTSKSAEVLPLALTTGAFQTTYYAAKNPQGVLIIATGDGGWSNQWEEPLALHAASSRNLTWRSNGWTTRRYL